MRLIVTGRHGQLATALMERGRHHGVDVTLVGRPELDLTNPDSVRSALAEVPGDAIVNAAAHTNVDGAEGEEGLATLVNGVAAGIVAEVAAQRGMPLLHISTDYVFGGDADRPYREDDPPSPSGAYGRSKLAGEQAVLAADAGATIMRTAWVYSPFGSNFVRTMLRLGETRAQVSVVADQRGCPSSALDLADGIIEIARRRIAAPDDRRLSGIFHMTGSGEATWADLADHVFACAERHGRAPVEVRHISTADYPTRARRPANSRLSNDKLRSACGVVLPDWRVSVEACVARLLDQSEGNGT